MNGCEYSRQVGAYHDGELSAEAERHFEAHLGQCPGCSRELRQLEHLSRLLSGVAVPGIPPDVRDRLHRDAAATQGRVIAGMSARLTAAAAAIFIVCSGWMLARPDVHDRAAGQIDEWEWVAVAPDIDTSLSEAQQFAEWIVADLSVENGND
ncbi:MAG: anti-sigma factor family protein [Planctomycetota bacterium]|jgi:anti-sigma factor RsiW